MKNKIIIVSALMPQGCKATLRKMGYTLAEGCFLPFVDKAVSYHIDMQLVCCGDNKFICAPSCYEHYKSIFAGKEAILCKGKNEPFGKYPGDVLYNAAVFGNYAVHNFDYTDIVFTEKNDNERIYVKQGYSKCNICVVGDNAIITSDVGIAKAMKSYLVDVLLVKNGHIDLPGYEYGFIGGCSGLIESNLLAFAGNISRHPDYADIKAFCSNHRVDICSLSDDYLVDVGTIVSVG